jgi:diacylglycerol O-acyltransferase / wax synthase
MEDKTRLMNISGLLTFAQPVDVDNLKSLLIERWLPLRRMRQRVVQPGLLLARPYWEDDPVFDLNAHVHRLALPSPGNRQILQEVVSDLISGPLDYSKPLWQIHVIDNYEGGGALLLRLHHVIADGLALAELMLHLTDETPQAAEWQTASTLAFSANGHTAEASTELGRQVALAARLGRRLARRLTITGLDVLSNPERGRELWDKGTAHAQSAMQLALKVAEPETIFGQPSGVSKKVAWSQPRPLAEVKQVQQIWGGTLNDVMLTALIGGLRRYLVAEGEPVNGARFRAAIPVNLRANNKTNQLGNQFGVVFLTMPLGMTNPQERLAEVRAHMDALKQSPEALTSYTLISALGFAPPSMQNALVRQFASLASAVITNVPGPKGKRYLTGQQIEEVMFWAPHPGRVGLAISIYSFADQVHVGVLSDPKSMPDPDSFINHFQAEYAEMVEMAVGRGP